MLPLLVVVFLASADDPPPDDPPTEASCGDGVVEGPEECDDGNTRDHDGCDKNCHSEPLLVCGGALPEDELACDEDSEECLPACPIVAY